MEYKRSTIIKGVEMEKKSKSSKFQVRDTAEELEKLDKALKKLGYSNRADWYRECKRKIIEKAKKE